MYKFLVFSLFISTIFFQACQKSDPVAEVDERSGSIKVSGTVTDMNGSPFHNFYVYALNSSDGIDVQNYGYGGWFFFEIPTDKTATFKITSICSSGTYYETTIGPFSSDTILSNIQINPVNPRTIKLKVVDCNGNPAPNAAVSIDDGNLGFRSDCDENGDFRMTFDCNFTNMTLFASSYLPQFVQSETVPVDLISAVTDLGQVQVCNPLDEYIILTTEGETRIIDFDPMFRQEVLPNTDEISGVQVQLGGEPYTLRFSMRTENYDPATQEAGVQSLACGILTAFGRKLYNPLQFNDISQLGPVKFSNYPNAVGEYAIGTLEGKVTNETGQFVPFSMAFRIKKTI